MSGVNEKKNRTSQLLLWWSSFENFPYLFFLFRIFFAVIRYIRKNGIVWFFGTRSKNLVDVSGEAIKFRSRRDVVYGVSSLILKISH